MNWRRVKNGINNKVANMSSLSPYQVDAIRAAREEYLLDMPSSDDKFAEAMTRRLMASSSVEIFNAYLPQIKDLYLPIMKDSEYAVYCCGEAEGAEA